MSHAWELTIIESHIEERTTKLVKSKFSIRAFATKIMRNDMVYM